MRTWRGTVAFAVLLGAAMTAGCASLNLPRIDPTGERVFVDPSSTACPPPVACPPAIACPLPVACPPQTPAAIPALPRAGNDLAITLSPRVTVAPVGSEVVLLAGVCGSDNYLRTNQRVEWSLSPGGVGSFVAVGKNDLIDWLLCDFNRPRKVDSTFAVGSTSRSTLTLDRGTPTTSDDVGVLSGQAWITVTSPAEGTSHVVAYAPAVGAWDSRMRSATIHWIDAQWRFPPPAINPTGTRHVFTTVVTRHSNNCPCVGWLVRYEIVDGPPAGFAPDGAKTVEIATDASGQAAAEIYQTEPGAGTNRINIQVIRPAELGGADGKRLVIGSGSTMKTWTSTAPVATAPVATGPLATAPSATAPAASAAVDVKVTGPTQVSVGDNATFSVLVTNLGQTPTPSLLIKDRFGAGLEHAVAKSPIERELGVLAAGESRRIEVTFRAVKAGRLCHTVEITGGQGLQASAEGCVTAVAGPVIGGGVAPGALSEQTSISVRLSGPTSKLVGETAEFTIAVTNTGSRTLTNLKVVDSFDPSLAPVQAAEGYKFENNALVWTIDSLGPGKTAQLLGVHCRCRTAAAKACNRVAVIAEDGSKFEDEACLEIREASTGLSMTVADLRDPVKVGQDFTYEIRVSNAAPTADQQVAVVVTLPTGMMPVELGTSGPGKRTIAGQTVRFDPVAEIRPNETLTYRVRALPQSPGDLTIHVELTSQNQPQPISAEESTKVFQ